MDPTDELSNWKNIVKPSRSDYKEFRDETTWPRHREHIMTTLHAHDLQHVILEGHIVTNKPLDKAQSQWLYKIFQDTMQALTANAIVTKHLITKDMHACWK